MAKFLMLGKYTPEAIKGISGDRTQKAKGIVKKHGGEVKDLFALLGGYDLVCMTEFPGVKEAMKASLAITKLTGIAFQTYPAVSVEEFDQLASGD